MRVRTARRRLALFVVPVAVILATQFGAASAALPEPEQIFFVPLPESAVDAALTSVGASTTGTMHSVISITAVADGTIVYYDEWEDGFEPVLESSVQSTTQVWGDNDPSNGIPPGFASDILDAGSDNCLRLTQQNSLAKFFVKVFPHLRSGTRELIYYK